jgi:hypothetical protein
MPGTKTSGSATLGLCSFNSRGHRFALLFGFWAVFYRPHIAGFAGRRQGAIIGSAENIW